MKLVTGHWSLVTGHFPNYPSRLKAFSIAFCLAAAVLAGGCADPIEKPLGDEAAEKFKRGITGQGTLGPMDRTDDPYIKQTHP
ncbi:MAG: hypothetical protein LC627_04550 [Verrucomicrobiaceae bacterium]|nr:hypothetical protein [Verrucomicrobiaceae bacterium]